jgi:dGTPase
LFVAYRNDVRLLPLEWRENLPEHDPKRSRHIGDFLAGMTDRYATDRHREIYRDMA